MRVHHIALIGVNSRIGPAILSALLAHPSQPLIFILLRPSSQPAPSHPRIRQITIPSDPPTLHDLTIALHEHSIETLISALSPSLRDTQIILADACVSAGVGRYIPADYGSMRSDDSVVLELLPNFNNKRLVREHCIKLAKKNKGFTWTSLVSGHFFDYGLRTELLGMDVQKGEALLFDGGDDKFSSSTTAQIGLAVAKIVLEKEDESANKMLLIQSFITTQKEVIKIIDSVKGRKKMMGKYIESKTYIKEKAREADKGDMEAVEELVAVLGIKRSNWSGDVLFANELLGLKEESMKDVVREVVADMAREKIW